jgi:hypothetical protein
VLLELKRAHDALLSCLNELERLTRDEMPDRPKLADTRWRLSKASAERRKLVDAACDLLMISALSNERVGVRALREHNAEHVAASSSHVRRWPIDQALADWEGYRAASAALRNAMRTRILQEQRTLYPLLDRAAA